MSVVNGRIAAAVVGVVAPLVMLAPMAQATTDLRCSGVVGPLHQCQNDVRADVNGVLPIDFSAGLPGLAYSG